MRSRSEMRFLRRFTPILVAATALTVPASASALALEVFGNFESPTYVTSDPGDPNRVFVVERGGRIELIEGGNTTTFLDMESIVLSPPDEGAGIDHGQYSVAFSPDYAENHLFYVAYSGVDDPGTAADESGDWHLEELRATGNTADLASRREVLTVKYPLSQLHYGGQLQFGPDGYLYASTGDGGPQGDPEGNAQNLQTLYGKILRIDPEGSAPGEYTVPADNPFTDTAGCTDGCDEIWSYGLRNPWRFSFDRLMGDLVIGDVGRMSWEEVDFETGLNPGRGDNFGWNCREGAHPGPGESSTVCADRVGTFTEPVFEYPHTSDPCSGAITGGYVVRDHALGELYGRYLYADYCSGELRSLDLGLPTASGDRFEGFYVPGVTSFGEDADCRIYVASFNGPVYRLTEPAGGTLVGCQAPDTSIDSGPAENSTTNDNTPTFEFSSTEPNSSFECQLDGDGFSGCTSPYTTGPLPDGEHTFDVRAIDQAANTDPTPASRTFTVDTLTLDLRARKQPLRKKLEFFATTSADSTLVARGKAIKETAKALGPNQTTKVEVKLKPAKRKQLQRRLDKKGKAKVKVVATATADQGGTTATDKITVKLED